LHFLNLLKIPFLLGIELMVLFPLLHGMVGLINSFLIQALNFLIERIDFYQEILPFHIKLVKMLNLILDGFH